MSILGRFGSAATFFPIVLAALLAGMTFWLEQATRPQPTGVDGKSRHDPDYMVENFEVRRFDPEGLLQHTLRATLMRHFPDDDSTQIYSPELTYHRSPPTLITSREAWLDGKGTHIRLIDDVVITRGGVAGKPPTVLTTAHIDAYPDDEIATSTVPVTITQGFTKVQGTGMKANNKTALYVLDGPVRGLFHRNGGLPITAQPGAASKPVTQSKPVVKPTSRPAKQLQSKAKPQAGSNPRR